jgi:hypothetical protein
VFLTIIVHTARYVCATFLEVMIFAVNHCIESKATVQSDLVKQTRPCCVTNRHVLAVVYDYTSLVCQKTTAQSDQIIVFCDKQGAAVVKVTDHVNIKYGTYNETRV